MSAQTPQKFTLEEISLRKKKLLKMIPARKKQTATTREIFAPLVPANNKAELSCVHSIRAWLYSTVCVGGQSYEEGAHVFQEFKIIRSSH